MTSCLPLALGVKRSLDAQGVGGAALSPPKGVVEKVLKRDSGTCCFCGFAAGMFQTVVPRAPFKGDAASFAACCLFCERSLFLDQTGISSLGSLIWLPEMTQTALNHVARALYVARASEDKTLAAQAARAIDALLARKAEAKKRLGTDDPLLLATALSESLDKKDYAQRTEKLEGIRLFPADKHIVMQKTGEIDIFSRILAYWTSPEGPFGKTPPAQWRAILDSIPKT